ncbi:MAG: TIGR04282 family arsenosugar biosynthesis glycosyltransferase [Calditrichia bacterium]
MKSDSLLIIFVKAPHTGLVKTRLLPQFSPEQASQLYRAMVEDLLTQFKLPRAFDVRLMYWPADSNNLIQSWVGTGWQVEPQIPGDLGEKMAAAFKKTLQEGYKKVLLIGSDVPLLNREIIETSFQFLESHDVVLGPSEDGGYYLVGMTTPRLEIFEGVAWSRDGVLSQTLKNARSHRYSVYLLERLFDVDEYGDVIRLWSMLQEDKGGVLRNRLPGTFHQLRIHFQKNR